MKLPPRVADYAHSLWIDRINLLAVLVVGLLVIPPVGIVLWLLLETGWRALVVVALFGVIGWLVYAALRAEFGTR